MKILRLECENIKRIKAAAIEPSGHLVVIGGPNDAGKSSFLDCIEMALGGANSMPAQPVRAGAKSGKVRVELGDSIEIGPELIVKLTVTASGGRALVVENKDGFAARSPQRLLDELYNALTFDPLAFERQDDKQQAETLRALVGLDTRDLDQQRQAIYDERTQINREVRTLQNDVETLPRHTDAPATEVSIAELAGELAEAERLARRAVQCHAKVRDIRAERARYHDQEVAVAREIENLRVRLREAESQLATVKRASAELGTVEASAMFAAEDADTAVPDTAAIRQRLTEAEAINVKVRANAQRQDAVVWLDKRKANAEALTNRIAASDAERHARIAAVRFPVPGLGFDEQGVTFEGLPFAQASSSTRTLVSMSIAIAKNPKLRVALVRDGSLIGTAKLQLIAEIAESTDAQVWLEAMQEAPNDKTSLFIEDGSMVPAEVSGR